MKGRVYTAGEMGSFHFSFVFFFLLALYRHSKSAPTGPGGISVLQHLGGLLLLSTAVGAAFVAYRHLKHN